MAKLVYWFTYSLGAGEAAKAHPCLPVKIGAVERQAAEMFGSKRSLKGQGGGNVRPALSSPWLAHERARGSLRTEHCSPLDNVAFY